MEGSGCIEVINHLFGNGFEFFFVEFYVSDVYEGDDAAVIDVIENDGEGADIVPPLSEFDFGM